jgi:hypothetical protein
MWEQKDINLEHGQRELDEARVVPSCGRQGST